MRHVLAVDDEPLILDLIQRSLRSHGGYRVSLAANAERAVKILVNDPPDGALIDAVLPGTSGIYLASHAVSLGVPTLLVTGEADIRAAFEDTGCPVLWKPFQVDALVSSVRALVLDASHRNHQTSLALQKLAQNRGELLRQIMSARQTMERVRADRAARAASYERELPHRK